MKINNINRQLKILFATNISGLGGGETSLINLISGLVDQGILGVLVCPEGKLHDRAAQLKIPAFSFSFPPICNYFGFIPFFSISTVLRLVNFIRKYSIDIVHVESPLAFYYLGLAAWVTGKPCVVTYHGYWQLNSGLSRIMLKYFCHRLYPVSRTTSLDIINKKAISPKKIQVIPLNFSSQFLRKLPSKEKCRIPFGLPTVMPIVMQVARFQPIKGQMVLLEALAQIVQSKEKVIPLLVYVGDILEDSLGEAVEYKELVENRAKQDDLRIFVRLMGWQDDIPQLMRAADIIVIPSDYETFSMTTIEAMASGTLVIATASGGPEELIQDHVTGLLIPPRNPILLANAIRNVLEEPSRFNEMTNNARNIALSNYSPGNRCNILKKEYLDIMSVRTKKRGS